MSDYNANIPEKLCRSCKETKLLTEFEYRKERNTYRHQCKECRRVAASKNRELNRDEINARRRFLNGDRREKQQAELKEDQKQYMIWYEAEKPEGIETGECWCGCGRQAPVSNSTNKLKGYVAGCPQRFIKGHQGHTGSGIRYKIIDTGYDTACWMWQRSTNEAGYGIHKNSYAHRVFYEAEYGSIPKGWHVHHLCTNKGCCRPSHLQAMPPIEHRHTPDHGFALNSEAIEDIKQNRARGVSVKVLAEKHGVKQSTISKIAPQSNYKQLTDDDRMEVRRLKDLGWLHKDIAAKFDKDTSTITRMLNSSR